MEQVKEFIDCEIRPYASNFDVQEALPENLWEKLRAKGYFGASLPGKYGGLEMGPVAYGCFLEEIGKGCSNIRGLMTVHLSLVGQTILRWGTEEQKNYWLPLMTSGKKIGAFALTEPEVGSDAQHIQTRYEREGNSYIIQGRKKWISFAGIADFFVVIAQNQGTVTAFVVEKECPGITVRPMKGLLASRASYISEVDFDRVRVPESHVLGSPGAGFHYVVNTALDHGRYAVAWGGVGLAQAALEEMISYADERSQFGRKLYSNQLIQGMIGDAVTEIHAARALCLQAGELREKRDSQAWAFTAMAKYHASKVAMQVAMDTVQVHGGNGCHNQYPAERLFREAKILEIIEGTSQIQQQVIAEYGVSRYLKNRRNIK